MVLPVHVGGPSSSRVSLALASLPGLSCGGSVVATGKRERVSVSGTSTRVVVVAGVDLHTYMAKLTFYDFMDTDTCVCVWKVER